MFKGMPHFLWAVLTAGVLSSGNLQAAPETYQHGAVAADHPLASAAGVEILQRGGNVIDAAVATAFALSVVRPESSGLGGGGFLVHWDAGQQQATAWDYRERAPQAATADMYTVAREQGVADASVHGILAVAVPGQIPGLCEIHRRSGKLPLRDVIGPALRLATEGVPVDPFAISTQRQVLAAFSEHPEWKDRYHSLWAGYLNSGVLRHAGERFVSPQRTALAWLSEHGAAAFDRGPIATALLEFSAKQGGLLTEPDLLQMAPVERAPLRGHLGEYDLLTMPPPSSGGVALLEVLSILEAWEHLDGHRPWRTLPEIDRWHLVIEATKHAFADRAEFLGDTDFVDVPLKRLLSPEHAQNLARRIRLDGPLPTEAYGRFQMPDDAGTTHFCVMDAAGNAVACTETINTTFGSYMVEPVTGIVLNNEMDDFTAQPGKPNAFGLRQSAANQVAPRKKPLSSMTPTIVLKDGKAVGIAGASGGPRIITATLQVLLRLVNDGQGASAAVSAPRWHHQWLPDELLLESAWNSAELPLKDRKHNLRVVNHLAATQAIWRTADGIEPASDPRKSGQPAGY